MENYRKSQRNKRFEGSLYEKKAADYLAAQGVELLERNYRCKKGEIDLIGRDKDCLVFVEVKYRSRGGTGNPLEAVNVRKQRVIGRVAEIYLATHFHSVDISCRFDVVGFEGDGIYWIKNAFDYGT